MTNDCKNISCILIFHPQYSTLQFPVDHEVDLAPPDHALHRPLLQPLGVHRHHGLLAPLRAEAEGGHCHHLGAGTLDMGGLGQSGDCK